MIIYNNHIPFRGFAAINLCGIIFVRRGVVLNADILRHERIHTRQQLEMLLLPFFVWYLAEWLCHLIRLHDGYKAYYAISFEREAYAHMYDPHYLQHRKCFAWCRYLHHSANS